MKKTSPNWTSDRLERLYDRYNKLYWGGVLPRCYAAVARLPGGLLGICDPYRKKIVIDACSHSSGREVHSTLLHEMAHLANGCGGHGEKFFLQLERLLQRGAHVTLIGIISRARRLSRRRFPL